MPAPEKLYWQDISEELPVSVHGPQDCLKNNTFLEIGFYAATIAVNRQLASPLTQQELSYTIMVGAGLKVVELPPLFDTKLYTITSSLSQARDKLHAVTQSECMKHLFELGTLETVDAPEKLVLDQDQGLYAELLSQGLTAPEIIKFGHFSKESVNNLKQHFAANSYIATGRVNAIALAYLISADPTSPYFDKTPIAA